MLNEFSKKEAPIQGLAGLGGGVPSRLLTLASGEVTYVDDVFSTFLYDGTGAYPSGGSGQTINNGIDLSGEGGMVWVKARNSSGRGAIFDTEQGTGKAILPSENWAQVTDNTELTSFNSNGFSLGDNSGGYQFSNTTGNTQVAWTFRKCPGFFDVVTYTGTGSVQNVSHSLGSEPGAIFIKKTSGSENWAVYHRSTGNASPGKLNTTDQFNTSANGHFNSTTPTDSVFTVKTDATVNENGASYVAYLFAHNDGSFGEDSDEAVIKCGSYTGTGTADFSEKTLGFEPQWVMVKRTDSSGPWLVADSMRGIFSDTSDDNLLQANDSGTEADYKFNAINLTPRGFTTVNNVGSVNGYGGNYIYIAIRRPHKPPEDATDVFDVFSDAGSGSTELRPGTSGSGVTDVAVIKRTESSRNPFIGYRILGQKSLALHTDAAATTGPLGSTNAWDQMQGLELEVDDDTNVSGGTFLNYYFTRAPGFMDVVTYTGNGSAGRTISHNLGVAPELMILTGHDFDQEWVWLVNKGSGYSGQGNGNSSFDTPSAAKFGNGSSYVAPTATSFTVGNDNATNGDTSKNYIALMFGSVEGISKVGTYTGTGSQLDIDCGFTGNARFVIIRHLSGGGHFMWFDTVQGIVSGNDQHWRSNTTANPVSHTDYIDPYTGGFSLPASDSNANASGSTYLFFAIA